MRMQLDGQDLFDEQILEIIPGSVRRQSIEKAVGGLDGVVSIDLGKRERKIRQSGTLLARSRSQMQQRLDAISACIDGDTHSLATSEGEQFDHVRMDEFRIKNKRSSGAGICVDYEIVYTQLVV
jgi:hypothetical protein